MNIRIRTAFFALAGLGMAAQSLSLGEIGGRLTDKQQSVLPGVRVRIATGDQPREAVTDSEGRFLLPSLPFGSYRVVAELAGFRSASGTIAISPTTPVAFLTWSLETECLEEIQRVMFGPRGAARLVDAIVHLRVAGPARPALMSVHPDCEGRVVHQYSVQVLDSWSERGRTSPGQRQVFMDPQDARLVPGHEYLALLWPNGSTTHDLILPITSGRVVSPSSGDLNGLPVKEALNMLGTWADERRR